MYKTKISVSKMSRFGKNYVAKIQPNEGTSFFGLKILILINT